MNRKDWKAVLYLLKDIYLKDKKRVLYMGIKAIVSIVSPYISIIFLGMLIDVVERGEDFKLIAIYILTVALIKFICTAIESRTQEYLGQKLDYTKDIEAKDMNEKAMNLDYEYLENAKIVDLRYKSISNSFYGIAGWCLLNVELLFEGLFTIIITAFIITPLVIDSNISLGIMGTRWSAIGLVFVIIVLTIINYRSGIHYTQKAKSIRSTLSNSYNKKQFYLDHYINIEFQKDIRINNWEKMIDTDVKDLFSQIRKIEYNHGNMYVKRQLISGLISGLSSFLIYFFAGIRAFIGMISIGNVVTYASSIIQFSGKMMTFAATLGNMKSVALFARDYQEFMTIRNRKSVGTHSLPQSDNITVEFEHVSFMYPKESYYALKDINMTFSFNEKIAVVGKNGSGKTTMVKLLCRLYEVSEGCIKINGINIKEFNLDEYWTWLSAVFQDFKILGFSVAKNVAGSNEFDKEKVVDSLKRAGIDEAENVVDEKVGKSIYDYGKNFSGGEKQKMAIARAIYKDSLGIIMDEPTAALDPISEDEIYAGFDKLVENKGALYISHRLSSCKFCKNIFVFDSGRLIQQGKHDELVNQEGMYKELWKAQTDCYITK